HRRHLVERDGVVAPHGDLGAELREVLYEVVSEGVVVVDHQDARHHSRAPMRSAWTAERALFTHSRCSASGSESATIPAPACTKARPSRITTVRMAIAVSIPPEYPKYPTAPPYTPRRTGSSPSLISIAPLWRAPLRVRAGNAARKASKQSRSSASWPRTFDTRCITCE